MFSFLPQILLYYFIDVLDTLNFIQYNVTKGNFFVSKEERSNYFE